MVKIAFFIPVYNKALTIRETIQLLVTTATSMNLNFEIIAIDDASTDNSWSIINELKQGQVVQVHQNIANLGFAQTFFSCVAQTQAEFGMYISADNDLHENCLRSLLAEIGTSDVILQNCKNQNSRPAFRRIISKSYTWVLNQIYGLNLKYYNGFNIYPVEFLRKQNPAEKSFAFQAELVRKAVSLYSFKEVAINCGYNDDRTSAFKIKNIVGVAKFVLCQLWDKKFG